ncbi:Na(+)/H(+) antiporter [Enhygromyxa salina]|uniref:Na(+)/H(+) antiporter n=1 Tax=Enhygromyxa salina TaxID=215803 RepID=A0A0C1ZYE0_9BACT|nr:cation:proton antiporter [Enhygromyxa salina]KIG16223.1 Na(+)/H(+) antiporter [Enhygromyxa salina]
MHLLANASTAVGSETEELVLHLLVQLVVILVATRVVTVIVRRLGQTDVSGEILAGLVLGPSALGLLFPEISTELFHPSTSTIFVGLAQIGLILLMFQIGMEFEFGEQLGQRKASVVLVSLAGLLLPFSCGYFSAPWFHAQLADPSTPLLGFRLFFAVSMSITAIPILGRIFMELGLSHTRTAALVIGSAAIDDVIGWLLLGSVSLIVAEQFSFVWAAQRIAMIGAYVLVVFFVVRPILGRWLAKDIAKRGGLSLPAIAIVLIVLLCSASITSSLGVFAIIGGFLVGLALHRDRQFVELWKQRVSPLVMMLLLPVFFAYTGLRTDIGAIDGWWGAAVCGMVLVVAFGSKFGGAFLAAKAVGEPTRDALTIGVCMNTRALMELIVINIGYDMGVVPRDMFTMLVIMALVSTFMATPMIAWLMKSERRPVAAA